jgi:hypothetical protein
MAAPVQKILDQPMYVYMYVYVTPITKMKSPSLMLMEKNSYQTYICEQNATSKPNIDRLHVFGMIF